MDCVRHYIFLAFMALSLLAGPATAQDLFDLSIEDLMNVTVVSTSYFDETLLSSASSVTTLSQQQWDERGSRNPGELLNTLPSTVAVPTNGGTRTLAIRGYFHTNTGVSVRLDNVPMNKLRPSNSLEDLDGYDLAALQTVELIRGPGSAMHGADAFHGVLSLQTLDPLQNSATLRSSLGSEEYGAASASGRIGDSQQFISGAVTYRGFGNQDLTYPYTDPDTGQEQEATRRNRLENTNVLLKYNVQPNASTRLYATTYLLDLDADELPGAGRAIASQSSLRDRDHSAMTSETQLLKLGLEHDTSDRNALDIAAFGWQNRSTFFSDLRASPLGVLNDDLKEESHYGVHIVDRYHFSDTAHLALGYEYNESALDNFITTFIAANNVILLDHARSPESGYTRKLHSLIVDGRIALPSAGTELVYGGRVDDYNDFDRQFSPRLGLLHTTDDQAVMKFLYGHAYRAPNLFEIYGGSSLQPNFDLQAEEMDSVELVYQKHSGRWFSALTLFQNWWSEAIRGAALDQPQNGYLFQFRNTGRNEAYGMEAETQAHWDQVRLNLAASYVRSRNVDSGEDFSAFPEWMLDLGWGYQFNSRWDLFINNRFMLRDAASSPTLTGSPIEPARHYARTDLELAWSPVSALVVRASVRNLFNRTNYLPSYMYHEAGIPDNQTGFSLMLDWAL